MTNVQFGLSMINQKNRNRVESALTSCGIDVDKYKKFKDQLLDVDQLIEITYEYNDLIDYINKIDSKYITYDVILKKLKSEQMYYEDLLISKIQEGFENE